MSMTGGIPIDCGSETRIRRYREDDLEALLLQGDHPQVAATLRDRFPNPYTQQDAEQWIALATGECSDTNFVIESGGAFAGGIGLVLTNAERRVTAEIGYWIGPDFWGPIGLAVPINHQPVAEPPQLPPPVQLPFAPPLAAR